MSEPPLLRLEAVAKHYPVRRGLFGLERRMLRAVDGASLEIAAGETLGLVGESGSGKTTLGRVAARLLRPSAGRIYFEGREITELGERALRAIRRRMQVVFQDPQSSLNPRMTVRAILAEPLVVHRLVAGRDEEHARLVELMERVGLRPEQLDRYPHEFSGGQRQRIGIARALAVEPRLIILDEPISALDVSVQAQIINLLGELQDELGLGYLFIAHDLAIVGRFSHRVAVMYLGRIVELGPAREIEARPRHPYTQALWSASPSPDPADRGRRLVLAGDVPSPIDPPAGCPFHPRCPIAEPGLCDRDAPPLEPAAEGHLVACHLAERDVGYDPDPPPRAGDGDPGREAQR